ncbi:MAG: hypothetical protein HUJ53_09790, partial [Holdemanella sp.]|nr:hypothetical protein [Holdemanella sp.]
MNQKMNQNTIQSSDYIMMLEASVLSSIINDPSLIGNIDIGGYFYYTQNISAYKVIADSISNGFIDFNDVYRLGGNELFNYIMQLQDSFVTSVQFQSNLARLQDLARKREILKLADEYRNESIGYDEYMKSICRLNDEYISFSSEDHIDVEQITDLVTSNDELLHFNRFIKTQEYLKLTVRTLNVIAARPGVGKSAFAINLFTDLAKNKDYRCIYVNMEMTEQMMWERIVGCSTGMAVQAMKKAVQGDKNYAIIKECISEYSADDIYLINKPVSITYLEKLMQSECRAKTNKGKKIVYFIDYLGYITIKGFKNRIEALEEIVKQLQIYTKLYDCTIFLMAQVNRQGSSKPTMADLKGTGELEQSAHCIMIIQDDD